MDKYKRKQFLHLLTQTNRTEQKYKEIMALIENEKVDLGTRYKLIPEAAEIKRELDFLRESLASWM